MIFFSTSAGSPDALATSRGLLERGYSITRDAAGKILKQPRQVRPGDAITSELAGGVLRYAK